MSSLKNKVGEQYQQYVDDSESDFTPLDNMVDLISKSNHPNKEKALQAIEDYLNDVTDLSGLYQAVELMA